MELGVFRLTLRRRGDFGLLFDNFRLERAIHNATSEFLLAQSSITGFIAPTC